MLAYNTIGNTQKLPDWLLPSGRCLLLHSDFQVPAHTKPLISLTV
jgi:hypothetical protein